MLGALTGISTAAIIIYLVSSNIVASIASALLAAAWRGRNPANWFCLSIFYGLVGLLFLACTKRLEPGESDTLSMAMWIFLAVPLIILAIIVGVAMAA